LDCKDPGNVPEVLWAFPFLVKNQLPEDHVFRWCQIDWARTGFDNQPVLPRPCKGRVEFSRVKVRLQTGRNMDYTEMPAAFAIRLDREDFRRRAIEVGT